MFTNAIVRQPCAAMTEGLTEAGLGKPDHALAMAQHAAYVGALEACGVRVEVLPPDEEFPDSTFVEDTAVLLPGVAVVARPGAPARRGEAAAMAPELTKRFDRVERIMAPGTLDGGDVMAVDGHYFVGLSRRTNREGATQLIAILRRHGLDGSAVPLSRVLHLKTGVAYLDHGMMVVSGEFAGREEFQGFEQVVVDDDEAPAANCVLVNGTVVMAAGHPKLQAGLAALGYRTAPLDLSEFRKLDGGASCLSLRF
jgi:dimethylargininase